MMPGYTNKIILRFRLILIYGIVFMLVHFYTFAQDTVFNKYRLWVITSEQQFNKTIQHDSSKLMVDLRKNIPGLQLELRYAGSNNFMHRKLYPDVKTTYLRKAAADSLAVIQTELNKQGLGLKIFDAYRPYSVTEMMWEPVKDDRYAADPKTGSGHNRGIAADLTIINLKTRKELDMGTDFDNFSDTAHHDFKNLPGKVLQNRLLLKTIMEKHGFKALETEWWHYYLPNAKNFELMDLSFDQLKKIKK